MTPELVARDRGGGYVSEAPSPLNTAAEAFSSPLTQPPGAPGRQIPTCSGAAYKDKSNGKDTSA